MGKENYSSQVLDNAPFAYAYHSILYNDADGKAEDFIFLDVNRVFENIIGLRAEEIKGHRASEVFPKGHNYLSGLLAINRVVPEEGEKREVEYFCQTQGKFYSVHIYYPDKDHFSAIFQEIISGQKHKEERLLISDIVFQFSKDMLCIAGNDGYFKSLNPAWSKTLGWDTAEMLSRPWIDFVHPDDRETTENIKTTILRGQEVQQFENRYRCSDGSYIWLSWNTIPLSGQDIMIGVARNITEVKTSDKALKESLDRNKAILQAIPDMMFVFNKQGVFVDFYVNDDYNLLMDPELFMGKKDIEVLPEFLAKINQKALYEVFATGQPQTYSYSIEMGGRKKHFDTRMAKMGDDKALSIVRDVTEQMDAELLLRQSEEKFRLIFETAPLGILHFDCAGIVTSCNQKLISIINSSRDRVIGVDLNIHPNKEIAALVKKVLNGSHGTYEGIYTAISTGVSTPVKIQAAPIMSNENQCNGGIALIEDRTLHYEREEFERQMAVARESVKFKQNFLANMSHEIRTPLTGILGMIDILSQSGHDREHLEILRNTSENLLEVVNQVLDYSKIEAGKVNLRYAVFQFHEMITDLASLYHDISVKNVKVSAQVAKGVPGFIEADRGRISQILNNLLSNAIKFTIKGSIRIEVELVEKEKCMQNLKAADNLVCIKVVVTDTGIGIEEEKQEKLFNPFVQIDASEIRNYDGTGLGLSICKQLAELHGGSIGVESESGLGSKFWFTFVARPIKLSGSGKTGAGDAETFSGKLNILLAEDKPINQKVISLMLTHMGHTVTMASHGEEVLEKYDPGKFDLILMDIQMPVMDGITATSRLRKMYTQLPPIVGLSANAFEGDRERYMTAGLDEYITKPLKKAEFAVILDNLFLER